MMRVYRGYDPLNPRFKSSVFPVKADLVSTIKEGMLIFPLWNASTGQVEWVLDPGDDVKHLEPHFALKDADDHDVVAADGLVGLPCSADLELHTPYFVVATPGDIVMGAQVTAPRLKNTDAAGDGTIHLVEHTSDLVIGVVTAHGRIDVSGEDNSFDKSVADSQYVIKIRTNWRPAAKDFVS